MTASRIGFAFCGSFCTLAEALSRMEALAKEGRDIYPIMSEIVYNTDTRFGRAEDFIRRTESACGRPVMHTIPQTEPIGPKALLDLLVVAPCTGNTMSKLASGITDTCVTMAVKAHLRNSRPVLLAPASNDALSGSSAALFRLMNTKNIFIVPSLQDDPKSKPCSLIADFSRLEEAMSAALEGRQLRPVILPAAL